MQLPRNGGGWINLFTYEFDQDGRFVKLDGRDPFSYTDSPEDAVYERDEQGRISKGYFYERTVSYIWEENRLLGYKWYAEGDEGKNTFDYDANGFIVRDNYMLFDYGTENVIEKETTKYSYAKIDEYGNWTRRKGGTFEKKRIITYYPIERK